MEGILRIKTSSDLLNWGVGVLCNYVYVRVTMFIESNFFNTVVVRKNPKTSCLFRIAFIKISCNKLATSPHVTAKYNRYHQMSAFRNAAISYSIYLTNISTNIFISTTVPPPASIPLTLTPNLSFFLTLHSLNTSFI